MVTRNDGLRGADNGTAPRLRPPPLLPETGAATPVGGGTLAATKGKGRGPDRRSGSVLVPPVTGVWAEGFPYTDGT